MLSWMDWCCHMVMSHLLWCPIATGTGCGDMMMWHQQFIQSWPTKEATSLVTGLKLFQS